MDKYGCDEKLTLDIINHQSGFYSGTEATVISDMHIGFKSITADKLFKD